MAVDTPGQSSWSTSTIEVQQVSRVDRNPVQFFIPPVGRRPSLALATIPAGRRASLALGATPAGRRASLGLATTTAWPCNSVEAEALREQVVVDGTEIRRHKSQTNLWRACATFYSFLILGAVDASYGALIPYLEHYYKISDTLVSLIFLSPLVGYILSALLNNIIHVKFGQRGIAIIGPTCHLVAFLVLALHPPYPVVVVMVIFAGFGNGVCDASFNAWIANMERANEFMGILHGFYGVGATVSPLAATVMITRGHLHWYYFYYVMLALATLELISCTAAFWTANGTRYRALIPKTNNSKSENYLKKSLSIRTTWIVAAVGFLYVGAEVSLSGWLTTFLIHIRHASHLAAGMVLVGFWVGITIGTVLLGFITPKVGERLAIYIYLVIALSLELVFWLVPNFIVSAVAACFLGLFLGPVFPTAIILATELLPAHLHVPAIGLISTLGGAGAAAFPFAVGAISDVKSVSILPPFVFALLATILGFWALLPRKAVIKFKSPFGP